MKHVAHVVVVAYVGLCSNFAAPSAHAQDPEADFDGFRIPDHSIRALDVSASGSFSPGRSSDAIRRVRNESTSGQLTGQFAWWRDSDALQQVLSVGARLSGARRWRRSSYHPLIGFFNVNESWNRQVSEYWLAEGGLRRYFESNPLAVSIDVWARGNYGQAWEKDRGEGGDPVAGYLFRDDERTTTRDSDQTGLVSLTVGAGRVRDATGIHDAYVLESRLRALGVLVRPLSPAARHRIAGLYYVSPTLARAFERPDKRFWNDIERILVEDGAIEGPLEAHALLRLMEAQGPAFLSTQSYRVVRRRGFFAGPVVRVSASRVHVTRTGDARRSVITPDTAYAIDITQRVKDHVSDENIQVGVRAEFYRPLGPRWQVDANGSVVAPLLHVRNGLGTGLSARLSYLVADRWLGWASLAHARSYLEPDPGRGSRINRWQVLWTVGADYFVEDRVRISLAFDASQARPYPGIHDRVERVQLSVGYTFLNDFAAPGLITPLPAD